MKYPYLVRDAVHGNIPFSDMEKAVIDAPLFQRLRNISQLGFLNFVFPCSNHTRFEHSLGTMHLAGEILSQLIKNQRRLLHQTAKWPRGLARKMDAILKLLEDDEILIRLRLAALIHDLGHGPYSHASECFTRRVSPSTFQRPDLPPWLRDLFARKKNKSAEVNHEWFSALMGFYLSQKAGLDENLFREVLAILDPEMTLPPGSCLQCPFQIRSLLHDLISSEIDADRMDYLLRDSMMTGVRYGLFDMEKLQGSLIFILSSPKIPPRLGITAHGLQAFEDYLFSRYQMYLQVYLHKTNTIFEAMLRKAQTLSNATYPLEVETFLEFTDTRFPEWIHTGKKKPTKKESSQLQELCHQIFQSRRPWKSLYLEMNLAEKGRFTTKFHCLKRLLAASPYREDYVTFESSRSLTKFKSSIHGNPKFRFHLVKRDILKNHFQINDVVEESGLINSFRRPLRLVRIFVRPEKREIIKRFINRSLS